ncbi:MAG TPA: ABC transporter permease [Solirubrobacterales bacterium]|nr:ABC transporter permease [Solirubrobacterales bacterium]
MTATTLPRTAAGPARLRWLLADSATIAGRSFAHIRQIPEKLFDVTLQPLMFVLLFSFVFGEVIAVPGGGDYKEYLIGGILVQTLAFGMMGPGVSMATDLGEGILDRFRSLPMLRPAFLLGHLTAEFAASVLAVAIMVLTGLIVGWRTDSSPAEAIGGFALTALLAVTTLWLGTLIGVIARSPDVVQGIAFLVIFPLTFIATTFVPITGLPDGLRQFAEYNPVSAWAAGLRTLFGNPTATPADAAWPLAHPVLSSVLWCVAILAVVVPLTLHAYRRRTTG